MSIGFDLQPPAARADRTPDLNEALRFLCMLAPETTAFAFRIFTDAKPKPKPDRLARTLHGILDALANDLTKTNARGAGIYVQINASDGAGQTRRNIKSFRAVFQEDDDGWSGQLPLEPSLVVESSPGKYHRYWFVSGDWAADGSEGLGKRSTVHDQCPRK